MYPPLQVRFGSKIRNRPNRRDYLKFTDTTVRRRLFLESFYSTNSHPRTFSVVAFIRYTAT
jgi:hypothetical protein